jgi:predicted nucleic acid-binding protein
MGFLIDTCIWIDLERGVISPSDIAGYTGEESVHISPVVIAELTFGAEMATKEEIRIRRLAAIERLREKPFVLIDQKTGEIFGKLAANLRREGKEHKYRIQDL